MKMTLGIDIGSTTVKLVVIKEGQVVQTWYERHLSQVRSKTLELIQQAKEQIGGDPFHIAVSGSAGLGVAKAGGPAVYPRGVRYRRSGQKKRPGYGCCD